MKSLSEKVIVIMGASSGTEATARLITRKGAKLSLQHVDKNV